MAKKKQSIFELKMRFNDIMMQELGLDITEENYLYDIEEESILQISEKYIKYFDTFLTDAAIASIYIINRYIGRSCQ